MSSTRQQSDARATAQTLAGDLVTLRGMVGDLDKVLGQGIHRCERQRILTNRRDSLARCIERLDG